MKIVIPNMVPPSPNVLRRKYRSPHAYKKLRDLWQQAIFVLTPQLDRVYLRNCSPNNRMWAKITMFNTRRYDTDNIAGAQKPILDALKNLGYIRDDSAEWLELEPPEMILASRKMKRTQIDIRLGYGEE